MKDEKFTVDLDELNAALMAIVEATKVAIEDITKGLAEFGKIAYKNPEQQIAEIKACPSLHWWEKRRMIKEIKKEHGIK